MATLSEVYQDWAFEMDLNNSKFKYCAGGIKHRMRFIQTEDVYGRYWKCDTCGLTWLRVLGKDVVKGFYNGYS